MDTKALRQKILDLAIRGKLVPQDPNDEPASVLLERIRAEKERLIAEGKIKRPKKPKTSSSESHYQNFTPPFEIHDSWEWVRLDDIAQSNIGLTYKPTDVSKDGTPVYRSNNIQNRSICKDDIVRVNSEILSNQFLHEGDLLICARNGSRRLVGKNAIIQKLDEPTSFGAFMAVCRSAYNSWIHILLNTRYFDRYLDASNSTAINQVTQKMLLDFTIPFPPIREQNRIISILSMWFNILDDMDKKSEDLKTTISNTKSKILELAMQGKLVPQNPTDEPAADMLLRVNPKARIITDNPHYPQLPSNWVYVSLEDIVDYDQPQPFIVNDTNYSEEYSTPVLTAGKSFILGYTNEDFGIYNKLPAIIFDDFTTDSHLVDFPFKVKSSAMKILTVKEGINVEFVSYFMSITRLFGDTHKRYWISEYSKLSIPLPPIAEQNRIVSAVRKFNNQIKSIQYILN